MNISTATLHCERAFGFTPLYLDEADVVRAVDILADIPDRKLWDNPEYQKTSRVI